MSWPLRHATASQEIPLGTFLDSTDGNTAETALTIANTDIKLQKAGATAQVSKNSGGATHIATGDYYTVLDATDTDTVGPMRVKVHVAGALVVKLDCVVYPAHVYDSLIGNANGPAPALGIIDIGTAQAVGATSLTLRAGFSATNDVIIGSVIWVYSSTNGKNERAIVTDWDNTTKVATIGGWVAEQPTGTVLYVVFPSLSVDAAGIRAAIGLGGANLDTQLATIKNALIAVNDTIGATGNDTTHLHLPVLTQGDDEINEQMLVILDASESELHVRAVTDWVNSTKLATVALLPFTPEASVDSFWLLNLKSGSGLDQAGVRAAVGLAAANLDTQLGAIDTVVDSILDDTGTSGVKVDSSTPVNATVKGIVTTTLQGDGTAGNPFRPV